FDGPSFTKFELMFAGTHVDAKKLKFGEARTIKSKFSEQEPSGAPLILAGDFNFDAEDPAYPIIASGGWKDSYIGDMVHQVGTFTVRSPTRRIDHVFY